MAYKQNWVTEACSYFDKMSQIESLNETRLKECECEMTCSMQWRCESHIEKLF